MEDNENKSELDENIVIANKEDNTQNNNENKEIDEETNNLNENIENTNQEEETTYQKRKREKKSKKGIIIFIIILIIAIIAGIIAYLLFRPKFKNVTIELGTSEIKTEDFLVSQMYENGAEEVTLLEEIDLSQVQETEITLSYKGKEETVELSIVDTTPPNVTFKEFSANLDYTPDPNDFIESIEDYSDVSVEFVNEISFEDFGTYDVEIKVVDSSGNETVGSTTLTITWLITDVEIELGSEFSILNIVLDVERFGSYVEESELAKVDTNTIGTYELYVEYEGVTYTCTVKVQDTTPPELELQNISIWNDETLSDYNRFVVSASDISGDVTIEFLNEIDYSIIGDQTITVRATDVNENISEKDAILTIKKDTTGPTISGLSNLTVSKNASIDFYSGVSAYDDKDGTCSFSVDSSSVNTSATGTYYAVYTSTDSSGNTTTSKRQVYVKHDQTDLNNKISEFYNNYCSGKNATGITQAVRDRISYSSSFGDGDPIWYGLTNGKGNCYVHAMILQAMLQKAGYSVQIIWTTTQDHYWNLVYYNGGWYHFDSTPVNNHLVGPATDAEKLAESSFVAKNKTWDTSKWPASP